MRIPFHLYSAACPCAPLPGSPHGHKSHVLSGPAVVSLDPPIVGGQNAGGTTEEMILHCVGAARVTQHVLQPELYGQSQPQRHLPLPLPHQYERCQALPAHA